MPNYYPPASGGAGGGGTPDDNSVTSAKIVDGAIVNADVNAAAAIALSKLASDPLARANHTGTQLLATISDAGTLAALSAVASAQITDGTIVGGDLSSTIAIPSAATATTQSAADSSTKVATTAFATTADNLKANIDSQAFTGTPTLPTGTIATTQAASDSSTKLATTAQVAAAIAAQIGAVGGFPKVLAITSDTTARTNNTLTNDATLLFAMGAADTWFFEAYLVFNSANTTMDALVAFTTPAAATLRWGVVGPNAFGGYAPVTTASTPTAMNATSGTGVAFGSQASGNFGVSLAGVVIGGGNAGNLTLQWSQNTTDANNLVLKAGSILRATRLA